MSDEKNLNEENNESVNNEEQTPVETEETTAEQAEETAETPAETEETPVETEVSETAETEETPAVAEENTDVEVDEAVAAAQAAFENVQKDEQKKGGKGGLIAIIVAAVIVVAIVVVLAVKFGPSMFNKYNRLGYVDVSGRTVAQVAEEQGMDVDEFLEQFDLPSDMPGNTTESAAYNCIPVSKMAEMYGMDFNTIKEVLKFPDDVDEDTAWGDAIGQVKLGDYVGEDNLAEFKETYGFGDDITADTLWKDVRQTVDEKSRQQRIESEKAEKESDKNKDIDSAESTEAPAETESADATEAPNA